MLIRPKRSLQPGQLATGGVFSLAPMANPSSSPTLNELTSGTRNVFQNDSSNPSASIFPSNDLINPSRSLPPLSEKEKFSPMALLTNEITFYIISVILIIILVTLSLQIIHLSGRVKFLESLGIAGQNRTI